MSQITGNFNVSSLSSSTGNKRSIKGLDYRPFVRGIQDDRWFPLTNDQLSGKRCHGMTSVVACGVVIVGHNLSIHSAPHKESTPLILFWFGLLWFVVVISSFNEDINISGVWIIAEAISHWRHIVSRFIIEAWHSPYALPYTVTWCLGYSM